MSAVDVTNDYRTDTQLLNAFGSGYMVASAHWFTRQGGYRFARCVVPVGEGHRAWLRSQGWPGHGGESWDYFKDDVRAFFRRLFHRS